MVQNAAGLIAMNDFRRKLELQSVLAYPDENCPSEPVYQRHRGYYVLRVFDD